MGRRLARLLAATALAVVLVPAASSQAQTAPPSDPSGDSPAGVIYQLPLDTARQDAAPRLGRGGNGGAGAGSATPTGSGGPLSAIRSENNFGSSSVVPGAASASANGAHTTGDAAGGSRGSDDRGGRRGGAPHARTGGDTGSPDDDAFGGGSSASKPTASFAVPLLGLTALLGLAGGWAATRMPRSR